MIPSNVVKVLDAAGYVKGFDFVAEMASGGEIVLTWLSSGGVSEAQINDYANDLTPLPSGQLFSQWLTEHGGDAVQTLRREAREKMDSLVDEDAALIRAAFIELATAHNQLLQWLGTQTTLINHNQLIDLQVSRQGIKDRINNGEADS